MSKYIKAHTYIPSSTPLLYNLQYLISSGLFGQRGGKWIGQLCAFPAWWLDLILVCPEHTPAHWDEAD